MNEPLINNPSDDDNLRKKLFKSEINKSSIFETSWLKIQESFENLHKDESEDDEIKDFVKKKNKKSKNKKGKENDFRDKIASADIKDWKEQRLHMTSFMEYLKSLFRDQKSDDIYYTFGQHLEIPEEISIGIAHFEENDVKFQKMDETLKASIETYGNQMAEYYIKRVLSNKIQGLTHDEVERRKAEYGPNQLPEKKKTPEIIKYLREITNVFSNLLWIAAVLAFIGYGLDSSDKSNV